MRLIDADRFEVIAYKDTAGCEDTFDAGVQYMAEMIDAAPTETAGATHGLWEAHPHPRFYGLDKTHAPIYRDGVLYCCSECRWRSIIRTRYCPNCGVKMR